MRVPRYVDVSDDLRLSRQKEAEAHREFMYWSLRAERNLLWAKDKTWAFVCFSHVYNVPKVAA